MEAPLCPALFAGGFGSTYDERERERERAGGGKGRGERGESLQPGGLLENLQDSVMLHHHQRDQVWTKKLWGRLPENQRHGLRTDLIKSCSVCCRVPFTADIPAILTVNVSDGKPRALRQ